MSEFNLNIFSYSFIQYALIAALLSGIAAGIIGTYVVVKRISYISGGIAHAVLGGLGAAYFWNVNPLYGALASAIAAALIIGLVKLKLKQNEDTVISALWAIGMSVGIIFANLTPGYNVDLISFLFGNILMITRDSLWLLVILDIVIVLTTLIFYKQFLYVSFDEEYSMIRGINVDFIYLLLLSLVALTVVILVQTVGLILVIALLTLPSAIAHMFSKSLFRIIIYSILLVTFFSVTGLLISIYLNIPSGASIILTCGIGYISAFSVTILRTKN
ncbi:MAG: metal ABC transporter permease [Bacteroidetes bacterium]|nr:metal ABC transporter permease [Bacteroidota bacterium]MBU1681052.1 metal ABC transporter permease [Bacteroidota bacterium]MBU2507836.1 metal ABC transporter permease [Bacteroidota bacterium]